jgi:arylsulfatase A-like enzyme
LSVACREETLKKYEQKGEPDRGYTQAWAAMMEELDNGVGRLLEALDELGIADDTYVFFTADNGGRGTVPGGTDRPTNVPLYGAKHSLYEGGIRVPFLAIRFACSRRWNRVPAVRPPSHRDLIPTAGNPRRTTLLARS